MRKVVDCRDTPNVVGCTLTIAGEEKELLETAVDHAMKVHGEKDTPELRAGIRGSWEDETSFYRTRLESEKPGLRTF